MNNIEKRAVIKGINYWCRKHRCTLCPMEREFFLNTCLYLGDSEKKMKELYQKIYGTEQSI